MPAGRMAQGSSLAAFPEKKKKPSGFPPGFLFLNAGTQPEA
jgi:hypothetical protein